jgi:hypothetical protein
MTEDEAIAVRALQLVTYPPASWDKRFARSMSGATCITEAEAPQVWRLFCKYRRQIGCPDKERLLALAQTLSAPDFRKASPRRSFKAEEERVKYEAAMKPVMCRHEFHDIGNGVEKCDDCGKERSYKSTPEMDLEP